MDKHEMAAFVNQMRMMNETFKNWQKVMEAKVDLLLINQGIEVRDDAADVLADRLRMNRVETIHKRVWP